MIQLFCALLFISTVLYADISEFQKLMGRETPHWIHVSKPDDIYALEKFETLYEKNKGYQHGKEGEVKIPKVIHFIWLGPEPFPPESVENVRTWIGLHPDWKVKFWTDREQIAPCSSMQICDANTFPFLFLSHCYEQTENWDEKRNILRYEILYQEGGVYIDRTSCCLQNFNGLHQGYDFYCGLETPHPPYAGRNITTGNGILGSRPFHPVVGHVIELIKNEWNDLGYKYRGKDGYSRAQLAMERTYMKLTYALLDRLDEDQNIDIVFPAAYFFAKQEIRPLYSKLFAGNENRGAGQSFEKSAEIALNRLQRRNNTIRWVGKGALSLNLLAFSGLCFYFIRQKRRRQP